MKTFIEFWTLLVVATALSMLTACGSQGGNATPAATDDGHTTQVNDTRTVINNVQCAYVDGPVTMGFKLRQYEDMHWEGAATVTDTTVTDPREQELTSSWDGASNLDIQVGGFDYTFYSTGMMYGVYTAGFTHVFGAGDNCKLWQ